MGIYLELGNRDSGCESLAGLVSFTIFRAEPEDPTPPFGVSGADLPCVPLEFQLGDLVIFSEELFHASFGKHSGRPRLALNFYAAPDSDPRFEVMRAE